MKRDPTFHQTIYILTFAIGGCIIGIVSGFLVEPNLGKLIFWPAISGLLDGFFLCWFYRSKKITANLIIRLGIGIFVGMFLGCFFGGMLGTMLSFPFPISFFDSIFLVGTFLGMFIGGGGVPVILANIGN